MTEETIEHIGVKRRSGRYPWGSGSDPFQSEGGFLSQVHTMKAQGMSEKDIAKKLGMNTSQLRSTVALEGERRKEAIMDSISSMKKDGLSNAEIGRRLNLPESTVRYNLSKKDTIKANQIQNTTEALKTALKDKPYLDVGAGVEIEMGISSQKLKNAVAQLQDEGYSVHEIWVPQAGNEGKWTTVKVLTKEKDIEVVKKHKAEIESPETWTEDGGITFQGLKPIKNVSWDRVGVRYSEDGGEDRDGLIQLRRGVKDLDLGSNHYAQVRIAVDGTHYVKGMAMYSDDLPKGVDILFNTNKSKAEFGKKEVFKKLKDNPDNPFGATVKRQKGALNIVNEEGDWASWDGSKFPSQFLSKQPLALVKDRLGSTYDSYSKEYAEIMKINNPIVRKNALEEFSNKMDSNSRHLKVQGLPRSKGHVLTPFPDMKANEVYAPNYKDGERVALVRYPHGGTFEIPELVVNNKNKQARRALGNAPDAIGIHPSVAHKLSGADFDGDAVYVIPNNRKRIKSSSSLKGLENFDPNSYYVGHKTISPKQKQTMMGEVSNLITDMTIKGASTSELTRAVRHSMVVIDSEKHQLDWKKSAADNGVSALRKKYQMRQSISYDAKTKSYTKGRMTVGAATLISRSKQELETSSKTVTIIGKNGKPRKVKRNITKTPLMDLLSDANDISSGTKVESEYASYINKTRKLGMKAKTQANHISPVRKNKEAANLYSKETQSLKTKLSISLANAPKERRAQLIANDTYIKNRKPDMTSDQKKKLKAQSLAAARVKTGAKHTEINFTDKEWEAVQAGAMSNNMLTNIIRNANKDQLKQLSTPRDRKGMSPSKLARAKTLLANGYTYAEVADVMGMSASSLYKEVDA